MLYSLPAQWLQHNTKKQQKRSQKQQKPLRRHNSQKPGIPKPQKPHKPQRLRTSYKIHIVTKATKEYKSQWSQDSRKPQKLEKLYKSHTKPRSQTEQKNTRPKNIPAPKRYTWNNYNCFRTPHVQAVPKLDEILLGQYVQLREKLVNNYLLVGGWATPLKNMKVS